jgi:HSP20 family protein
MLTTSFGNEVRQTLDSFRRTVDQLFDNFYGVPGDRALPPGTENRNWVFSPALESGWTQDALHLRAVVPGVAQNDIKVSIENNQFIIEGERKAPEGFERNTFTHMAYGRFYTSIALPVGLDLEKLNCRLHDGVLDIRIPLAEASKPRQIQIQAGEERKSIGA